MKILRGLLLGFLLAACASSGAWAQSSGSTFCIYKAVPPTLADKGQSPLTCDVNAYLNVDIKAASGGSIPVTPGSLTVVALDIATVTTGGTPVNALSATHAAKGGFVMTANAAGICINVLGAAGTATTDSTTCVAQNQVYNIPPTATAISVNSTASSVALAGYGFE